MLNQDFSLGDSYVCSFCGKKGVKLWRPYGDTTPLICAVCAEERQSPRNYDEVIWKKQSDGSYEGKLTGKKLPLPKWQVDEKGHVPSYQGPGPKGSPLHTTDQLIIDLGIDMIPAVPDDDGNFWTYSSVPEYLCEWWNKLPTK